MVYAINPQGTFVTICRMALLATAVALLAVAKSINVYFVTALSVCLIVMAMLLKTRGLEIYDDRFVIHRRCWLKRFDTRTQYDYSDIKEVTFSPGYTNWARVVLFAVVGMRGQAGATGAPSEWRIVKSDNSVEHVKSIGTNEEAEKAAKYVNSRLRLS